MCFSANASFLTSIVAGTVGIACIARVHDPAELPLAAMPLVFSIQQAIEGALWLMLPIAPQGGAAAVLTWMYVIYAKVLWPVYAPMAAVLVEPDPARRRQMIGAMAAGTLVAVYFVAEMRIAMHQAVIVSGHIAYENGRDPAFGIGALYIVATVAALLLSTHAALRLLGVIVAAGAGVSFVAYWQSFSSVWCFFAAAASIVVLGHFRGEARCRVNAAGK